MSLAHIGVGLFAIGVTVTQTYKIEKDIALRPGETVELQGYTFDFNSTRPVDGPELRRDRVRGRRSPATASRSTSLHPQKRVYRVQNMPMTEAGIHVDWNRDLFVAMGEDLGAGAWSMRLQYKPLVRFIWLGALIMALGGLIAITDRRYRRSAPRPTKAGAAGAAKAALSERGSA